MDQVFVWGFRCLGVKQGLSEGVQRGENQRGLV